MRGLLLCHSHPRSFAYSNDETAIPKTCEARADKCDETTDKKMGARKREDAPPSDDSSGSEKSRRDLRIRRVRELADVKKIIRGRDDAPPSDESSGSEKSKKDRHNRCERKKREDCHCRNASPNTS